ncbi:hypothetical protein [Pyxidicoccus caerfyrddinensis]|uniref:hypothetical protein n=1 Tax=Pyxidicoccus caerfyrddinensis TaxID=2709663 RepID=UPI00196797CE|nr:hypothetical protein [Pyxidicoccus caerfyrddinensis]
MKTFNPWLRALCALLLLSGAAGCKVEFPNDVPYTCDADADCGGDGYLCTALPNDGPKYCCLPEEGERCNNVDDDCDGAVDELDTPCYTGPAGTSGVGTCKPGQSVCDRNGAIICVNQVVPRNEECNGKDDDCDGSSDEDFDLQTDPGYCGRCETACTLLQNCVNGECVRRGELDCGNGVDDNNDGPADCADRDDCDNQACGEGCVCRNGRKTEANCGAGGDEDNDGLTDCADRDDCDNKACGTGCACVNGRKEETECGNQTAQSAPIDDDGDGSANCVDSDCDRQSCGDGKICQVNACVEGDCANGVDDDAKNGIDCADTAACTGEPCGQGCTCGGGKRTETDCTDGISNDGDPEIDCADPDCNTKVCVAGESNTACVYSATTPRCAETNCRDTRDNDGADGADCADRLDCDYTIIVQPSGQVPSQMCIGGSAQETNCSNNADDDGDGKIDCAAGNSDENCVSGECGLGCNLTNCVRRETLCGDGRDNDGNNGTDCADTADCDNQSCGTGCVCAAGGKKETLCADRVDNDGNNGTDCADSADCPQGTACTRSNGAAGTCQPNKSCG